MQLNLLSMCMASFMAVFTVLAFLAITMRLIMIAFPVKKVAAPDDAAMYAAITSAYTRMYPGMRISNITEEKK